MATPILKLKGTNATPEVNFNALTGELSISGRSIQPDPLVFYQPLFEWLDHYLEEPCHNTVLSVNFEYISSTSIYYVSSLLIKMNELVQHGHYVKVRWQYQGDDPDIRGMGEDYAEMVKIPFELAEVA